MEKRALSPTYNIGEHTKLVNLRNMSSDANILREQHQFIRDDDEDRANFDGSWELRMARKYYDKLFKEYAIADLTRYEEGKIGLRWRVENEVVIGKGQYICGNKPCNETDDLHSYEVPFRYLESGVLKTELVKVRTCPECSVKLFFKSSSAISRLKNKCDSTEETSSRPKKRKKSRS